MPKAKLEGYHRLKVPELKVLLKHRRLYLTGNKDTLVDRLEISDTKIATSDEKKVKTDK